MKKLKNFKFEFRNEDQVYFENFTQTYKNSLECLEVTLQGNIAQIPLVSLYKQIIMFTNLSKLQLFFMYYFEHNSFDSSSYLAEIAEKCTKLNELDISICSTYHNIVNNFKSIDKFKSSIKISIKIATDIRVDNQDELIQNLMNWRNLQVFDLDSYGDPVQDIFLLSINENLPRLKFLILIRTDFTEQAFESISKLKHLRNISLSTF